MMIEKNTIEKNTKIICADRICAFNGCKFILINDHRDGEKKIKRKLQKTAKKISRSS